MAFRYSTKLFNEFLGQVKTQLADGVIHFYSGAQPASPDNAVTATLISTVTVAGGAFTPGSPTNGLEFGTVANAALDKAAAEEWKFTCVNAGTIGWGRFVGNAVDAGAQSAVLPRIDFSVGITSGDMRMSKVTYAVGETGVVQQFLIPLTNIS